MEYKERLKLKKRVLAVLISRRNEGEKQLKKAFKKQQSSVIMAAHRELERLDKKIQKLQMGIIILTEKIRQSKHRKG